MAMSGTFASALACATRYGWPVLPIAPNTKRPLTVHGLYDATVDPEQIATWWTRWPTANVALATGWPGPDVLDIEGEAKPGGSGFPAYRELQKAGLIRVPIMFVSTPSRGMHLYYPGTTQPSRNLSTSQHIEVRSRGSYILAPPSTFTCPQYSGTYEISLVRNKWDGVIDWSAVTQVLGEEPSAPSPPPSPPARDNKRRDPPPSGMVGVDDFNAGADWDQLLTGYGWERRGSGWRRPGKTDPGISATVGSDGRLYVYSTSISWATVRPDGRAGGHSPFDVYCAEEYAGDRKAAWRALQTAARP